METRKAFNRSRPIAIAVAVLAFGWLGMTPPALAQTTAAPAPAAQAEQQARLQAVQNDKSGHASAIVSRWEGEAQASGKWDANYAIDMFTALVNLAPERLLAAFEARSYAEVLNVLAGSPGPATIGSSSNDLVYTPIAPCRIVDTRNIASPVIGGSTRDFDLDNAGGFAFQGGVASACGPPFGVATAAAMTITVTGPVAAGHLTAWSFCGSMPLSSVINFVGGETIANTTIVPDCPGVGNDFSIFAASTTHVVIDVVGYFGAPVATLVDDNVLRGQAAIAAGAAYDVFSPACPAGWRVTGGGALMNLYSDPAPIGSRPVFGASTGLISGINSADRWLCQGTAGGATTVFCFVVCGRVPGR